MNYEISVSAIKHWCQRIQEAIHFFCVEMGPWAHLHNETRLRWVHEPTFKMRPGQEVSHIFISARRELLKIHTRTVPCFNVICGHNRVELSSVSNFSVPCFNPHSQPYFICFHPVTSSREKGVNQDLFFVCYFRLSWLNNFPTHKKMKTEPHPPPPTHPFDLFRSLSLAIRAVCYDAFSALA